VPPFFLLPAAAVDIPELQTLAKIRRGKLEIGGVGDWGREQRLYGEGTWIWRANLPRALSMRDPAAATIRDDKLYSGGDSRRFGLGERDLPVVW